MCASLISDTSKVDFSTLPIIINIVTDELIYIEYDFEELSDKGIEECEKNNYTALCVEAFEELVTL